MSPLGFLFLLAAVGSVCPPGLRRGMTLHSIWARIQGFCQRRMARWLGRRLFTMPEGHAIVSFTFDDFPRSALFNGGGILERLGLAGTYYASLGLMKQMTPTGEIFQPDDLQRLVE